MTNAFDTDQEIHSPGEKAKRGGKNVGKGYALGVVQTVPIAERASLTVSKATTRGLESGDGQSGNSSATTSSRPTFSWSNCNFYGTQTQADFEEMASMYFLKMQSGNSR
jgi:hypothetical protein